MGGLRKHISITYLTFLIGVLAISGIPPFAGFFSKDEILAKAFEENQIAWGVAVVASLLTSFYMFRLLFLVFFGNERASADKMHHIHESPKSITVPLMILAGLSTVGGFMGVPQVMGGGNWVGSFLSPVFAKSAELKLEHHLEHSTELMLMGTIVVLTLAMIGIAYVRYVSKSHIPAAEGQLSGIYKTVYHKYYIDEIYDAVVVRPLYWFSKLFDIVIEKSGIDRVVNLAGEAVYDWSKVFRLVQNGSLGLYIFVMVIGVILIIAFSYTR